MLDDLKVHPRSQPFTHSTHITFVSKLLDMLSYELPVEDDQDYEAKLVPVLIIKEVVLSGEDQKEGTMEDKVAHEDLEHGCNILFAFAQV